MESQWEKEKGAVIVVALFVVLALVVVGSLATMLSTIELDIARNDRFGKEAFFIADAGCPLSSRVIRDMILHEGIEPSAYSGITFDSNLLNEVRNYFEDQPHLNDKDTDTPDNNPDIAASVMGKDLAVDIDWRWRKAGAGGSLLFAMGYEGIGADRSHGGVKIYYNVKSKGKATSRITSEVGAVYLYQ